MDTKILVAIIFLGLFALFMVGFLVLRPVLIRWRLSREGLPAVATVIQVTQTSVKIRQSEGYQVRDVPVMEIKLQINRPEYAGRYLTTGHVFAYGHMPLQAGGEVKVLIDPKDPGRVVLSPNDFTGRSFLL